MVPRRTPTRPHQKRGEAVVALVCLLAVLCADLVLIRFGVDAQDEGYFLEQASRVAPRPAAVPRLRFAVHAGPAVRARRRC